MQSWRDANEAGKIYSKYAARKYLKIVSIQYYYECLKRVHVRSSDPFVVPIPPSSLRNWAPAAVDGWRARMDMDRSEGREGS